MKKYLLFLLMPMSVLASNHLDNPQQSYRMFEPIILVSPPYHNDSDTEKMEEEWAGGEEETPFFGLCQEKIEKKKTPNYKSLDKLYEVILSKNPNSINYIETALLYLVLKQYSREKLKKRHCNINSDSIGKIFNLPNSYFNLVQLEINMETFCNKLNNNQNFKNISEMITQHQNKEDNNTDLVSLIKDSKYFKTLLENQDFKNGFIRDNELSLMFKQYMEYDKKTGILKIK